MNFKAAFVKQAGMTKTENGAVALSSSGNKVLDLWSGITRDSSDESLLKAINEAWIESPIYTLKCMFAKRDIRGECGQGERRIFTIFYRWLFVNFKGVAINNIRHISEYGYWKDLLNIPSKDNPEIPIVDAICKLFATQLKEDMTAMKDGRKCSLAAKWIPSVNSKLAKSLSIPRRVCYGMMLETKTPCSDLRKQVITPLRKYIDIVEKKMCEGNWNQIVYSRVPSLAMTKYRNAFNRNDEDRFYEYIESVYNGDSKINTQALSPVDLMIAYNRKDSEDKVLEAQWRDMIKRGIYDLETREGSKGCYILPVCDVSGSMSGKPMAASIGLGAYISKVNQGFFKDLVITFSEDPKFVDLSKEESLFGIANIMTDCENVGYNTDIEKTFIVLLEMAKNNLVSREEMPDKILLISDMEFDEARGVQDDIAPVTNLDSIRAMYKQQRYDMPQIIFWNVRSTSTTPCRGKDKNVLYVGGYSKNIVTTLMTGSYPDPLSLMYSVLDSERYSRLKVFS